MKTNSLLKMALSKEIFAEIPDAPFNIFFREGASVTKIYPYLFENQFYTVEDYWMNAEDDIMVKLIGFNHYIKFVEGGMYITPFMGPN